MQESHLSHLINVLDDHDILYDTSSLKTALRQSGGNNAIESWIRNELGPNTLLTKDELSAFNKITTSEEYTALQASEDLMVTQDVTSDEIRDAIEALKQSTVAIEKQNEVLRLKQKAMDEMIHQNSRAKMSHLEASKIQSREWDKERADNVVYDLQQNLHYQAVELEEQCRASQTRVRLDVDNILSSDDKLFSHLQKLLHDLSPARASDDRVIVQIKETCMRLVKYSVERIRTKLDQTYLKSIIKAGNISNNQAEDGREATSVLEMEQELESLYAEIVPVAQMSIERQFLEPALRETSVRNKLDAERFAVAIEYVQTCLEIAVKKTELLLDRVQRKQCHDMASHSLIKATQAELLKSDNKPAVSPTKTPIPRRRKSSSSHTPSQSPIISRRYSLYLDDKTEPEVQVLRNLGISFLGDSAPDQARTELLERTLLDRMAKFESHVASLQSTIEASTASHLSDAHKTVRLLEGCLSSGEQGLGETDTGSGSGRELDEFRRSVVELRDKLDAIQLQDFQKKNKIRDEFVARWTR